jgi:hypothetical protein
MVCRDPAGHPLLLSLLLLLLLLLLALPPAVCVHPPVLPLLPAVPA